MNSTRLRPLLGAVLWIGSSLIATGTCQGEPFPQISEVGTEIEDPLEPLNRFIFDFNLGLDDALVEPAVLIYQTMLPLFFRDCIHDALVNLNQPLIFVNCILQVDAEKAGTVLLRFIVNSTFGLLGLFDIATEAGLPVVEENFGQTLKKLGVSTGPYLVLPLLGPSSFRGGIGLSVDFFLDPLNWLAARKNHPSLFWARSGLDLFDKRVYIQTSYAELKKTSLDLYATMRSLYDQKRGDAPVDSEDAPRPSEED